MQVGTLMVLAQIARPGQIITYIGANAFTLEFVGYDWGKRLLLYYPHKNSNTYQHETILESNNTHMYKLEDPSLEHFFDHILENDRQRALLIFNRLVDMEAIS